MKKYWTASVEVVAIKRDRKSHTCSEVRENDLDSRIYDVCDTPVFRREDVRRAATHILGDLAVEAVVAIYLNHTGYVIGAARLAIGVPGQCAVYPRNVYAAALMASASSVILVHNHPAGSRTPSNADWEITKKLKTAGEALEIPLLDHLILVNDDLISMREESRWNTL